VRQHDAAVPFAVDVGVDDPVAFQYAELNPNSTMERPT
jgi:hypothetical protein